MIDLQTYRERYDRDGFVVVPQILSPERLEEVRAMADRVLDGEVKPDTGDDDFDIQWEPSVMERADLPRRDRIRIVFHMTHTHPFFRELARSPELLRVMRALIGPELKYYTDQMFVKPAHHGSEVPWHQDAAYWPAAEARLVSMWLALDDVTVENGCVRYIPGTHRAAVPHHMVDTDNPNKLTCRPETVDPGREVPVEMEAGSACIHHSLAIHRSCPNTSDHRRRGLVMIYLPADTVFYRPWPFKYGFQAIG